MSHSGAPLNSVLDSFRPGARPVLLTRRPAVEPAQGDLYQSRRHSEQIPRQQDQQPALARSWAEAEPLLLADGNYLLARPDESEEDLSARRSSTGMSQDANHDMDEFSRPSNVLPDAQQRRSLPQSSSTPSFMTLQQQQQQQQMSSSSSSLGGGAGSAQQSAEEVLARKRRQNAESQRKRRAKLRQQAREEKAFRTRSGESGQVGQSSSFAGSGGAGSFPVPNLHSSTSGLEAYGMPFSSTSSSSSSLLAQSGPGRSAVRRRSASSGMLGGTGAELGEQRIRASLDEGADEQTKRRNYRSGLPGFLSTSLPIGDRPGDPSTSSSSDTLGDDEANDEVLSTFPLAGSNVNPLDWSMRGLESYMESIWPLVAGNNPSSSASSSSVSSPPPQSTPHQQQQQLQQQQQQQQQLQQQALSSAMTSSSDAVSRVRKRRAYFEEERHEAEREQAADWQMHTQGRRGAISFRLRSLTLVEVYRVNYARMGFPREAMEVLGATDIIATSYHHYEAARRQKLASEEQVQQTSTDVGGASMTAAGRRESQTRMDSSFTTPTPQLVSQMSHHLTLLGTGQAMVDPSQIPANMLPTQIQLTIPHHPFVDALIPWPTVRDRLILAMSNNEITHETIGAALLQSPLRTGRAQPFLIWGHDTMDVNNWEVDEDFVRRFPSLFDATVLRMTNWWRAKRGQQPIRVDDSRGSNMTTTQAGPGPR